MNIGVIGVGSMGQNHARVLSQMGHLSCVMDRDRKMAEKIGARFEVPYHTELDELLKEDIDGVTVATPAHTHFDISKRLIQNGIPLLVEKPFTGELPKAEELVDRAEEKDLTIAVGMIERHNPIVSTAKKLLDKGDLGDIITMTSKRVSSFPGRVSDAGVIQDLAIHDIDVMRYLLEDEFVSVFAQGGKVDDGKNEHEDHANMMLQSEEGVTGVAEVNWLTPHKVRELSITCSNDYLELDYTSQSLVVASSELLDYDESDLFDIPIEENFRRYSVKRQEPLEMEMKDFVQAVKKNEEPLVTGEDALVSIRVVEAALESLQRGNKVRL